MDAQQFDEAIQRMESKSLAVDSIFQTTFSRKFYPRLPAIVRNDVKRKVERRTTRTNATKENLCKAADDAVKFGLKCAAFIENKYSFVDCRNKAQVEPLSHNILMRDDALSKFSARYADQSAALLASVEPNEYDTFLDAMTAVYLLQKKLLADIHVLAPAVNLDTENKEDLERFLTIAVLKMQSELWIEKRLLRLRAQYIEYAQIAMQRVGEKSHQSRYVSDISFLNWKRKQQESQQFMQSMSVFNEETGENFKLEEVAKRTVSNPENRRIEMMVRSRGFEELAEELGFTALFITWTLPSKYHRVSHRWNGASVKEGHTASMAKWAVARAKLAKKEVDYFGFRVAEPHKDGTSHSHYFLFCHPSDKQFVISTLRSEAIYEDREELGNDTSPRFDVTESDPSKGGATAYIAKYVSKNINGKHMPETEAEESAFKVRAWASVHRIRQFQQFGGEPVSLWRALRKTTEEQTCNDPKLEALRQAADSSKWALFCQLASSAKLEYQNNENQYGETVRKIIGFSWLGSVIETASECYSLVKTKDLPRLLESRSGSPWSTENKCNSPLIIELRKLTGWSIKGVTALIKPLKNGASVPIDQYCTLKLNNGRLRIN